MYDFGSCPRCQMELSSERLQNEVIVCNHCGYTGDKVQSKKEKKAEKRFIQTLTAFCAMITVLFVMIVQWDTFFIEIIPLKTKQLAGSADLADLQRIQQICASRKNLDCQMQAYKAMAPLDNEAYAELGRMQSLLGDTKTALVSFQNYFKNGGLSLDASYNYARTLEKDGQIDKASEYYDNVLAAKPNVLQITVTKNYIKMLMDYNKKKQAKVVLLRIRRKGSNTKEFMDPVFKELEKSIQ